MARMPDIWSDFLESFKGDPAAAELLSRPSVVGLADRMAALCPWVAEQIHGEGAQPHCTMVHGDYKAMNVFVTATADAVLDPGGAALIDFQWTGVGLGMLDVAMHLYHSVELAAMEGGGEAELVQFYHSRVTALLSEHDAAAYTKEVAQRHYNLCVLDYGRVVMSCFWAGASANAFAAKAARQNCSMVSD
jgi:aminoglycoside phosphotransferase (APT) family kinase protein